MNALAGILTKFTCQYGGYLTMNKKIYKFIVIFLLILLIATPLLRIFAR
jgi:hypothetical protein